MANPSGYIKSENGERIELVDTTARAAAADVPQNTAARHTHSNATALDSITADKIALWDAAAEDYSAALGVI